MSAVKAGSIPQSTVRIEYNMDIALPFDCVPAFHEYLSFYEKLKACNQSEMRAKLLEVGSQLNSNDRNINSYFYQFTKVLLH